MAGNLLIIFGAKYLLLVVGVLVLAWFLKQSRVTQKRLIFFAAAALPLIFVISRIVTLFYYDPRPFVVGHFIPLIPHEPDNGFPSDHTLLGAAIAAIVYPFSKKVSVVAWLLTILMGIFRVLAGVHQPIDIIGSIIIAIFVGLITRRLVKRHLETA